MIKLKYEWKNEIDFSSVQYPVTLSSLENDYVIRYLNITL